MVTVSDNPKWHEDILKVINAFKDSFALYNCDVIDFLNAMKTMLNYSNQVPVIVFDQKGTHAFLVRVTMPNIVQFVYVI